MNTSLTTQDRSDAIYTMEQKPVFVRLDEYKNIIALVGSLQAHVDNAKATLAQIHKLKQEEDVELEIWQTVISEIESRTDFINTTLTQPEEMQQ